MKQRSTASPRVRSPKRKTMPTSSPDSYSLCDAMIASEMEWLLHNLWHKEAGKPVIKYNFKIPDTVIYKICRPYAWYFTSKEGFILKKTNTKLTHEHVHETFSKKLMSDVVATAYRVSTTKVTSKVTLEYLHKKEFKDFIYFNEDKLHLEILQKFPVCKGKYNEVIRCDWTPTINMVEKRVNQTLFSKRCTPYEKVVTYEGPTEMSKSQSVVSKMLLTDINVACKFIADQLTSNGATLKHANFYFKIDTDDELVLLFANNFKVEPFIRICTGYKDIILSIPESAKEDLLSRKTENDDESDFPSTQSGIKKGISTQIECPFCKRFTEKSGSYEFTLKFLLDIYEYYISMPKRSLFDDGRTIRENLPIHQIFECPSSANKDLSKIIESQTEEEEKENQDLSQNEENSKPKVPKILHFLYKNINFEAYQKKMNDPNWLYKSVLLCDQCYNYIKDISDVMVFNKTLNCYKDELKIDSLNDNDLQHQLNKIDSQMYTLENTSFDDKSSRQVSPERAGAEKKDVGKINFKYSNTSKFINKVKKASVNNKNNTLGKNDFTPRMHQESQKPLSKRSNRDASGKDTEAKTHVKVMKKCSTARILLSRSKARIPKYFAKGNIKENAPTAPTFKHHPSTNYPQLPQIMRRNISGTLAIPSSPKMTKEAKKIKAILKKRPSLKSDYLTMCSTMKTDLKRPTPREIYTSRGSRREPLEKPLTTFKRRRNTKGVTLRNKTKEMRLKRNQLSVRNAYSAFSQKRSR
ncbi:unnamed protein product [Moneuplotes crassus]|uniref:Uncharacterized protein n=1 Tax=Euplotes crassus TaxID=5936 RepID=A0AAD1Y6Y3_EUPCR|nr:unnamed protein product [Moneuplotes crassus]